MTKTKRLAYAFSPRISQQPPVTEERQASGAISGSWLRALLGDCPFAGWKGQACWLMETVRQLRLLRCFIQSVRS